jgi:hypothetical protein
MKYTKTAALPTSKREILRSQKAFGIKYPSDFIRFLQDNNGGAPLDQYRCFDTSNNTKVIDHFLGLMEDYKPIHLDTMSSAWSGAK